MGFVCTSEKARMAFLRMLFSKAFLCFVTFSRRFLFMMPGTKPLQVVEAVVVTWIDVVALGSKLIATVACVELGFTLILGTSFYDRS